MGNQNHRFKGRNFNYSRNDLNNKTVFGGSRNDHSRKENKGASSNNKSAYNPNRAFFDRKINTGESFQKPQDASRFLDAVMKMKNVTMSSGIKGGIVLCTKIASCMSIPRG